MHNILLIDYNERSYKNIKCGFPHYNFWWARNQNESDKILQQSFSVKSHADEFFNELWITILDYHTYRAIRFGCHQLKKYNTPIRIYQSNTKLIDELVANNFLIYRKDFFKCKTSLAS